MEAWYVNELCNLDTMISLNIFVNPAIVLCHWPTTITVMGEKVGLVQRSVYVSSKGSNLKSYISAITMVCFSNIPLFDSIVSLLYSFFFVTAIFPVSCASYNASLVLMNNMICGNLCTRDSDCGNNFWCQCDGACGKTCVRNSWVHCKFFLVLK